MKHSGSTSRFGHLALGVAVTALALAACSKKEANADTDTDTAATAPAAPAGTAAAPAAGAPAAAKIAADNVDTAAGVKYASYTGDAAKGKIDFLTCQTCHSLDPGVNKIGPSLHLVVGRHAGKEPGFTYTAANKDSGITWTEEKLFQYLENPQRVVPGTKMTFAGWPADPQKRADVIAYLKSDS